VKRFAPRAFTFIELLAVIAIVAVLAILGVAGLQRAQRSGKSVACISNLRQLGTAIERVKEAEARHGHINVLMVGGSVRAFKFDEIPKNDSVNTSTPAANGRAFWRGF